MITPDGQERYMLNLASVAILNAFRNLNWAQKYVFDFIPGIDAAHVK
jgi:hypothetical protein